MTYQPTALEIKAKSLQEEAAKLLIEAAEKLDEAADALGEEEKKHAVMSISNQRDGILFQQVANEIDTILKRLTGEGRVTGISSTGRHVRTISNGFVKEVADQAH